MAQAALVVEDGTGKADADAYVSRAEFTAYCHNRGYRIEEVENNEIDQAIRKATDWADTTRRYRGTRLKTTQALEFPRQELIDWSGELQTGVPRRLKQACCEMAYQALTEPLLQNLDRGGKITTESVGSLSTSYADDAPVQKLWALAEGYLAPLQKKGSSIMDGGGLGGVGGMGTIGGPEMEEPGDRIFSVGMNDYPGGSEATTT